MAHINPSIPSVGQPNSSEEPKIVTALSQLVGLANTLDDQSASTDGVWRHVLGDVASPSAVGAGTYFPAVGSTNISGSGGALPPRILIPNASDYAVLSRTTKLRVQAVVAANAAPSGTSITFGLYPIIGLGGSGASLAYTLGTVVAGSTVTVSIATSAGARGASTAFSYSSLAANGYILGFTLPATTNGVHLYAELQMQHV